MFKKVFLVTCAAPTSTDYDRAETMPDDRSRPAVQKRTRHAALSAALPIMDVAYVGAP